MTEQVGGFCQQDGRVCVCKRAELFGEPDKVFLGSNHFTTLFADLEFVIVNFAHSGSIEAGQVPFIRELYSFFCCADAFTVSAKDAGVASVCKFSYRWFCVEVICHG